MATMGLVLIRPVRPLTISPALANIAHHIGDLSLSLPMTIRQYVVEPVLLPERTTRLIGRSLNSSAEASQRFALAS